MAHGKKYFHSYCDSQGTACEVQVLKKDYLGPAIELEGQPAPFKISYANADEWKFEPIRPTSAKANFVFGTGNGVDFEEFWQANEKEFKVLNYVGGQLDWAGYVIPNGFAYELRGGKYYATLTATDGLGTLENLQFIGSDGKPYGNQDLDYNNGFNFPWVLIATEILRKLELDLNLWTCVNIYERTMTKTGDTRNADPLASSFVNVKTYINDSKNKNTPYWYDANSVMNCKQVLENLCYCFGAKVYQSGGVWRIKSVESDMDYGSGATQLYWRKYNTAAVYLSPYEPINETLAIPCKSLSEAMIGTDHIISMDDVYKNFLINYDFRFVRNGDTIANQIKNGDFEDWQNTSKFATPPFWDRWSEGSNWKLRAKPVTIPVADAGGHTTGIQLGVQADGMDGSNMDVVTHPWNSIRQTGITVTKGDKLFLSMWIKFQDWYPSQPELFQWPVIRMILRPNAGLERNYYLRNNTSGPENFKGTGWTNEEQHNILSAREDVFFVLRSWLAENYIKAEEDQLKWYYFNIELEPVPVSGRIDFDLVGQVSPLYPQPSHNFPEMRTYFFPEGADPHKKMVTARDNRFQENGGPLHHAIWTGIELGIIPDPEERGEHQEYKYPNPDQKYSLQVDPITVLNGDVNELDQISRITVPSNTGTGKNFWTNLAGEYSLSSIGLVVVKQIMRQYIKPFRLLEGTIKAPGATIDTKFTFEALPGLAFMLLGGTFDPKKNYIEDAVFFEISEEEIPDGGTEGNITLDPVFRETGNRRCNKDGNHVNTGVVEVEYSDVNTNSETYGETTWVSAPNPDLAMCPIGEPTYYYWGTDTILLDVDNLQSSPWSDSVDVVNGISVNVSNPGGEYVYFLHLDSLTIVEHIVTTYQEDIISDFQYLADVTINGYLYKVLRQNYVTADFENFPITFQFA